MTTTTKITNAIATAAAIELLKTMDQTKENNGFTIASIVEKLELMHVQQTKPRAKTASPSQIENRKVFMPAILKAMSDCEDPITAKWVCENVKGVMTSQKAASLLSTLANEGFIDKVNDENSKRAIYKINDRGLAAVNN